MELKMSAHGITVTVEVTENVDAETLQQIIRGMLVTLSWNHNQIIPDETEA